ncbi:hypothetical protein BJ508DRAFT_313099 [Ascobolus immersus RN42]|uniref:Uncharacterized protein n=1 Tax=Ascobolus immersus RN42 TaxID=1160509 RepID=A0A3N4HQX9_ASCIM|nr:hypothetical protein BJ508DRAFT_313099 [Ascobolus immersus RN42]
MADWNMKQPHSLGHKAVEMDPEVLQANRRNFTKLIGTLAGRRFGRENGPNWRALYTPIAGKAQPVMQGFRLPRSVDDVVACTDAELAFTLRCAQCCSHNPANGRAYHRYEMMAMIFTIVGANPPDDIFANAPAFPKATNPDVTPLEAVTLGFPDVPYH